MTLIVKRLVMVALGALAAFALWPLLLAIQSNKTLWPDFFVYTLLQGLVFGSIYGFIFGSFEGIAVSSSRRALNGALFGALAGLVSGALGMLAGQALFFFLADRVVQRWSDQTGVAFALSRGAAWVIIGIFLSLIEGLRSASPRRLLAGLAGGITGGLIGGILLQTVLSLYPDQSLALLAGLVLFGAVLAFFYSFFENRFSAGTLRVLNGRLKGREYHLVKNRLVLGAAESSDILLSGYQGVSLQHACIRIEKGKLILEALPGASVILNDRPLTEPAALRREDVIGIGKARLIYGIFF